MSPMQKYNAVKELKLEYPVFVKEVPDPPVYLIRLPSLLADLAERFPEVAVFFENHGPVKPPFDVAWFKPLPPNSRSGSRYKRRRKQRHPP